MGRGCFCFVLFLFLSEVFYFERTVDSYTVVNNRESETPCTLHPASPSSDVLQNSSAAPQPGRGDMDAVNLQGTSIGTRILHASTPAPPDP